MAVAQVSLVVSVAGFAAIILPACRSACAATLSRLLAWEARQKQRAALRSLDDRLLRDVGLTRPEAEQEAMRHD